MYASVSGWGGSSLGFSDPVVQDFDGGLTSTSGESTLGRDEDFRPVKVGDPSLYHFLSFLIRG